METFNLSQSYPTQDIRKRTSFLTIGLSICLLAAGISLFFLPESTSESNINALKIAAGSLLAVISFYFLIFRLLPIVVPFNREATQRYGAGLVKNKIHNRNLKDFRAIYQSDPFSYSKSYSDAHF